VFSLTLDSTPAELERLLAELYECGTAGIVEEEVLGAGVRLRAFFDDDAARPALVERFAAQAPSWRSEPEVDWTSGWRDSWQPTPVGEKFFLVPVWSQEPTPAGRWRLEVDPGMAFGTGAHATTQLCLEALERYLLPGDTVFDLGTGSGILARAAALAGAGRIYACDIDADSAAVAHRACQGRVHVFAGSLRSLRAASVDLLLANINAETLSSLAGGIAATLRPAGRVIASGFPPRHRDRVHGAFGQAGLTILDANEKDGWVGITFAAPTPRR
jgi:ribosomal protein L11 methyltransferase